MNISSNLNRLLPNLEPSAYQVSRDEVTKRSRLDNRGIDSRLSEYSFESVIGDRTAHASGREGLSRPGKPLVGPFGEVLPNQLEGVRMICSVRNQPFLRCARRVAL